MAGLMMKLKQLINAEGQDRVSPANVIAEFDFGDTGGEWLDRRADLNAQKAMDSDAVIG